MNKSIENNIQAYVSYFRDQVQSIVDHCPETMDGALHSRILCMALLDAISRSVFGQESNKVRIVQFISRFCDWPEYNRVSLPHLYRLFGSREDAQFTSLRNFASGSILKWIPSEKVLVSRDPEFTEVEKLWPRDGDKLIRINGISIQCIQQVYLLYTYRNNLVHEFRMPGKHVELWNDSEPYYAYLIEYKDETSSELIKSWELQYTARFFWRLCITGLTNLEKHFITNEIDPFKSIDRGNYWVKELNL